MIGGMTSLLGGTNAGRATPDGITVNTTTMTSITIGASANTKGSWIQLSSSVPFECAGFVIHHWDTGGSTDGRMLYDIGIGTAGNENVIVENIYNCNLNVSTSTQNGMFRSQFFPLGLRSGVRVAARAQANVTTGKSPQLGITFLRGRAMMMAGHNRIVALGADTANTRGTPVGVDSSTAWTSWTQIASSVPQLIALHPYLFSIGAAGAAAARQFVDLGIGSAGNEHPLVERLFWQNDSGTKMIKPTSPDPIGWFGCNVPSAARISARAKNSISQVGTATDMIIYGLAA